MPALLEHPWFLKDLRQAALTTNDAARREEVNPNVQTSISYSNRRTWLPCATQLQRSQTEDQIRQLLKDAQTPGPNKFNFSTAATFDAFGSNAFDHLINKGLEEDKLLQQQQMAHQQQSVVMIQQYQQLPDLL
eukprot:gene21898-28938_t